MWSNWRKRPLLYVAPGRVALVGGSGPAKMSNVDAGKEFECARELVERAACSALDVLWGAGFVSVHFIRRFDGVVRAEERAKVARAVIAQGQASPPSVHDSLVDVVVPDVDSDWLAYQLPRSHVEALGAALSSTKICNSGALCAEVFSSFELASPAPHIVAVLEGARLSWVAKSVRALLATGQVHLGTQVEAANAELRRQGLRLGIADEETFLCVAGEDLSPSALLSSWRSNAQARTLRLFTSEAGA